MLDPTRSLKGSIGGPSLSVVAPIIEDAHGVPHVDRVLCCVPSYLYSHIGNLSVRVVVSVMTGSRECMLSVVDAVWTGGRSDEVPVLSVVYLYAVNSCCTGVTTVPDSAVDWGGGMLHLR